MLNNELGRVIDMITTTEENEAAKKCKLQVATINCHFRLPADFTNLDQLLTNDQNEDTDIYCINLQQIVYRGKRTIFAGDAEARPS